FHGVELFDLEADMIDSLGHGPVRIVLARANKKVRLSIGETNFSLAGKVLDLRELKNVSIELCQDSGFLRSNRNVVQVPRLFPTLVSIAASEVGAPLLGNIDVSTNRIGDSHTRKSDSLKTLGKYGIGIVLFYSRCDSIQVLQLKSKVVQPRAVSRRPGVQGQPYDSIAKLTP